MTLRSPVLLNFHEVLVIERFSSWGLVWKEEQFCSSIFQTGRTCTLILLLEDGPADFPVDFFLFVNRMKKNAIPNNLMSSVASWLWESAIVIYNVCLGALPSSKQLLWSFPGSQFPWFTAFLSGSEYPSETQTVFVAPDCTVLTKRTLPLNTHIFLHLHFLGHFSSVACTKEENDH